MTPSFQDGIEGADQFDDIDEDLIDDSFGGPSFVDTSKPMLKSTDEQFRSRAAALRALTNQPSIRPRASEGFESSFDLDDDDDDDVIVDEEAGIRSYTLTGGRTTARSDVMFETVISPSGRRFTGAEVSQRILTLVAEEPISVAEVAVHISIPLGVARVLVSDLLDTGHLVASTALSATPGSSAPSKIDLLKRVISRVEAL